jgi:hypothetical protein
MYLYFGTAGSGLSPHNLRLDHHVYLPSLVKR